MKKRFLMGGGILFGIVIFAAVLETAIPRGDIVLMLTDAQANSVRAGGGSPVPIRLTPEQTGILIQNYPTEKIRMVQGLISVSSSFIVDGNHIELKVAKIELSLQVRPPDSVGRLERSTAQYRGSGSPGAMPRVELSPAQLSSVRSAGGTAVSVQLNQEQAVSLFRKGIDGGGRYGIIIVNGAPGGMEEKGIIIIFHRPADIGPGNLLLLECGDARIFLGASR